MLIDTHTHLETFLRAGTAEAAIARAGQAGVGAMITIGTSSEDWRPYEETARKFPGVVHFSAGLHPCSVDETWERELEILRRDWDSYKPAPVALGEIGLDRFHLPKDPAESARVFARQQAAFAAGLALAREKGCPIVVHSRGAFHECVEAIDASGVDWTRVVFHCFTEGPEEMEQLNRRGGLGSFTGIITYKSAETTRAALRVQGLTRLMLETDAPYLTPVPHRGKPNEPAYLALTAAYAADLFGVGLAEFASITSANAREFFGL